MRLIQDLIDALSKPETQIEDALILAQVLAHKLSDKEMATWVDSELNGYAEQAELPDYRHVTMEIRGNVRNIAWSHNDTLIALNALTEKQRQNLTAHEIREGVGQIAQLAAKEIVGTLTVGLHPEVCAVLSRQYEGGYHVERAWGQMGLGTFKQVLTQIRSRLLRFVLQLQDRFPGSSTVEEIKKELGDKGVSELFHGAVFGPNTTIVVGDNNALQGGTNTVVQNDFDSLARFLQKQGVGEKDIHELHGAIEGDAVAPEHQAKEFGPRVRRWLGDMVAKGGSKALETGTSAGVTALFAALKAHYGWP